MLKVSALLLTIILLHKWYITTFSIEMFLVYVTVRKLYVGLSKSSRNSPDWKIATTDSMWSKNDHRGVWTRRWHLSRIHSCDFSQRFEDETCQCEVCSVWFLNHNDAPSHTSLVLQQFLAEKSIPVITQLPYSLDLAPSDFRLFPILKIFLKGTVSHHGGHRIECEGWTPEDSKRSLPPVHPTMAGSMEQVWVCAQGSDFEGD